MLIATGSADPNWDILIRTYRDRSEVIVEYKNPFGYYSTIMIFKGSDVSELIQRAQKYIHRADVADEEEATGIECKCEICGKVIR